MELPENKFAGYIHGNEHLKWIPVNNHNIYNFTEDEIKRITNNYGTLIGRGGFGEVFCGVIDDGTPVAVKKFTCHNLKEGFAKEITVHCQINHKNVVRLLGYCWEENALMMVTEYISRGNLRDLLHGNGDPISLDARLGIATDCAEALSCMHSSMYQPIIHGDIKPDNILVDGNLGAKLADFGISRLLSMDGTQYTMHIAGSRGYIDPEHLETGRVDPKNDVYSFGVVLVELLTRAKVSENGVTTGLTRNFTQALEKGKKTGEMCDTEIADVTNMLVIDEIGKLAAQCLRKDTKERPEMIDVAEQLRMLRKVHRRHGQEKVNWQGASTFNSNSTMVDKLDKLDIFNSSTARRNVVGNVDLRIFTQDELTKITNNYSDVIGNPSFGKFYKGTLEDNTSVAVKRYIVLDEASNEVFDTDVSIMSRIFHKNIIKLLGCCLKGDVPVLVYEFAVNGSLEDILCGYNYFPLGLRLDIAIGTAEALSYLHSQDLEYLHSVTSREIIHGNIQSANVLLDGNFVPKVSEFVSPMHVYDGYFAGAPAHEDPVFSETGQLTSKSDVYNFGIILMELITRAKSSKNGENMGLIRNFIRATEKGKKVREMFDMEIANVSNMKVLEKIGKLSAECLRKDFKKRPTMKDVAERLRILRGVHCQQGEGKPAGQWSLGRI